MAEVSPQQILDEQGYLIFACCTDRYQIGDVVEGLTQQDAPLAPRHAIPGPAVITGIATLDEYQQQAVRFFGTPAVLGSPWNYFYKAVAE